MSDCNLLLKLIAKDLYLNHNALALRDEINDHMEYWRARHRLGWYYQHNKTELRNQPFHQIDDRGGLKTIKGIISEFFYKLKMIRAGFQVTPEHTKEGQVWNGIDLYLDHPAWNITISCQVKSITTYDHYGHFKKKTEWVKEWFKSEATRIVLVDETFILWADRIMLESVLLDEDKMYLTLPWNELSLYKIQNLLEKRFPSQQGTRYALLEKI
jgi:hypothetical protein